MRSLIFKRRQTEQRQERAADPVFAALECHSESLVPRVVREPMPRLRAQRRVKGGRGSARWCGHNDGGGGVNLEKKTTTKAQNDLSSQVIVGLWEANIYNVEYRQEKRSTPPPNTHQNIARRTKTKCTSVRLGVGKVRERGHCLLSGLPQHHTACLTSNKATGKGEATAPVSRATGVSKQWKRAAVWRLQGSGWHTWLALWPGGLGTLARHWHAALCRWLPSPPF